MKLSFKLLTAALVIAAAPAFAAGTVTTTTKREQTVTNYTINSLLVNTYVAGKVGYNNPTGGELDENAVYSLAAGYRFNPNFRLEGEVSYRENDISLTGLSGESKTGTAFVNGWYDWANTSKFTPYVGGGIGIAHNENKGTFLGTYVTTKDYAFAYQVGGGVAYALCPHFDLTADYRFIDTSNFDDTSDDYKAHEVLAGVRYSF